MKNIAIRCLALIIALSVSTHAAQSQGKLLNKLVAKVAKKTGEMSTQSTATIEDVQPTIGIASNLHPKELGTISQGFFEDWTTGGQQVFIIFSKKNAPGFFKVDGSVKVNGQEINYVTSGMYSIIGGTSDSPRKIDITSSSGQKSSFVIEPVKTAIKVVSINGKKDKISLDLSQDVTMEVEGLDAVGNPLVKVSLAINQVGIKSIYDVCFIRSGSTLTIPAAAFRNINIAPGGDGMYNYKNSFLSITVESLASATEVSGSLKSIQYTRSYSDGKLVTVSKEPELNTGLKAKGKENLKDGEMEYDFFKPNAFTSRPVAQAKKIGVLSFAIQGKTVAEKSVITQEENLAAGLSQTTKTTTVTFPQQTDAVWDGVLAKIYPEITEIVRAELAGAIHPTETVPNTTGYKSLDPTKVPGNTKEEFLRTYGGTKSLSGNTNLSEGIGNSSVYEKIMNEAGLDALLTFTLSLDAQEDGDYGVMVPTLTFELAGKANGLTTSTKYFTGTVVGKGVPSENIGLTIVHRSAEVIGGKGGRNDSKTLHSVGEITPAELDKIIRRSDLLNFFRKGLQDVIAKEKANTDYATVWSLQN